MNVWALQTNPVVGDLIGNSEKIIKSLEKVKKSSLNIVVTSELAICGYAPCDYLLNREFVLYCFDYVERIAEKVDENTWLFIGLPMINDNPGEKPLYNSCAICNNGRIVKIVHKTLLPTYDVFDEARYFEPCKNVEDNIIHIRGKAFGVTICEDIWNEGFSEDPTIYGRKPVYELWKNRADIIVNLSASPFVAGKPRARAKMVQEICANYNVSVIYVNQVGANDSLVFDGRSMMVAPHMFYAQCEDFNANVAPAFETGAFFLGEITNKVIPTNNPRPFDEIFDNDLSDTKNALILGIKDYFSKLGLEKAVIGMSGGVDSALTAALAVEALGPENVYGVSMPTQFNSEGTKTDARKQAENMGISFQEEPINYVEMNQHIRSCTFSLTKKEGEMPSVVRQNVQARIRGMILMGITNAIPKSIVLSTGNKSELSMGYCTLYGDMAGGLNVLGDVYKTEVFELAKSYPEWIPESVWTRPPSAELEEDQVDEDSLPPYKILDPLLHIIVDQDGNYSHQESRDINEAIVSHYGEDEDDIFSPSFNSLYYEVERKVRHNEYKRQQGAPSIKVSNRTLTNGWRRPIVANIRMY